MSLFRHSIPGLMTLVLLVALDCTAVRTPLSGRPVTDVMLLLGARLAAAHHPVEKPAHRDPLR